MPDRILTIKHPHLIGLVGQLAGTSIDLKETRLVLGRDASQCQIVLAQSVISKVQAALEVDNHARVTLIDLSSKQTTYVNEKPVTRQTLRDGDRIGFGVGGVVAFRFCAASPGVEYRDIRDDEQARGVMRMTISAASPSAGAAPQHQQRAWETAGGTMILRAAEIPTVRLGRAPDNNFVLDAPSVSRYHAILSYANGDQPTITDLGSTNGTFINGELLTEPRPVTSQDLIFLGGFLLNVDGRTVKQHDLSASSITARHLSREIGGKTILKDVSLAVSPREFIGLMGPSGCGKSTLMDALNGLRPATSGQVCINDLDLYANFNALRRSIGYVPQRDILHDALTVERTLYYAARMRLPEGTSPDVRRGIVNEVIETVGLAEQRHNPFRQLSGGQQKRLSLGFELITKPSFIFLDEPTSPLDPETTENMMLLFRRLADEGRIVVMVTHKFEKFHEMHHIAMLTRGGRLAYFGPPAGALEYFQCKEPGDIYRVIGAADPDQLSERFQQSDEFERYIKRRIAQTDALTRTTGALQLPPSVRSEAPERRLGLSQWLTLTRRYLEIKLKDRRNTLLLLAQAPIVAAILAMIVRSSPVNDAKTLFIAAIISIWFGANNAVREIVSESAIYVRERMVNLKIPSYVFSKFAVLIGIALIQCVLFVGIIVAMGRLKSEDLVSLIIVLFFTSVAGITTGLFLSAVVNSTEKAMSILPLVLIPQLLLSGFMVSIDDIYYNQVSGKPASEAQYREYEENKNHPPANPTRSAAPREPIGKYDGLGAARYAAVPIVARWTLDALTHAVSIEDKDARERLPGRMTVAAYESVLDGKSEDEIASAYRTRLVIDCGVLALFSMAFLALTMWALKRKDVL